jgi:hypothetical protein
MTDLTKVNSGFFRAGTTIKGLDRLDAVSVLTSAAKSTD